MPNLNIAEDSRVPRELPNWVREEAYGFLYWLAFLLVLEPGNVFRALQSGHELAFDHEAPRIVVAALLGTSVTPIVPGICATRVFKSLHMTSPSATGLRSGKTNIRQLPDISSYLNQCGPLEPWREPIISITPPAVSGESAPARLRRPLLVIT
jgi:hypothetical protein